jgi:hypothetical protein
VAEEGKTINFRRIAMTRTPSFLTTLAVFAALVTGGCVLPSSSSSDGGPTWEEPLEVSCRFTERYASGYGSAKSEEFSARCVNSTCYGAGEPSGWVEIGDYWSNTSWSGFQEYHGSCEDPDAQPVSCEGMEAADACTFCVMLNFCGSYLRATTDPNARWYLGCVSACDDESCLDRCTKTGEDMPYESWAAIEELVQAISDPWCAHECGR